MKKLPQYVLCLLIVSFSLTYSVAQVSKGQWMIGGYGYINPDRFININVSPTGGYMISDKIAIGAILNIEYANSKYAHYLSNYLIPTGRYYFGKSKTQPFILAGFGVAHGATIYKDNTRENNSDFSYYGGGALGLSHLVNNNIAIEVMAGYSNSPSTKFAGTFVNFGFQIFLNKKNHEEK